MTSHTFAMPVFSSSLELFLLLHYLPHSKPRAWFYFDDKCSDTKIEESVACKQK